MLQHLTILPNPVVNTNSIINFSLLQNGNVNFEIVDLLGNVYYSFNDYYDTGENSVTIDTKNIPMGTYICRLLMNKKTIGTVNFIKTK